MGGTASTVTVQVQHEQKIEAIRWMVSQRVNCQGEWGKRNQKRNNKIKQVHGSQHKAIRGIRGHKHLYSKHALPSSSSSQLVI
jgi:hypothetical protein